MSNSKQAAALSVVDMEAVSNASAVPPLTRRSAATAGESACLCLLCQLSAHRDFDMAVASQADVPHLNQIIVTGLIADQLGEGTNISR